LTTVSLISSEVTGFIKRDYKYIDAFLAAAAMLKMVGYYFNARPTSTKFSFTSVVMIIVKRIWE